MSNLDIIKLLQEILKILHNLYSFLEFDNKSWVKRRWLVRPINQDRECKGFFNTLYQDLKRDDDKFFKYTRMNYETFVYLLELVKPFLLKRKMKNVVCAEERLVLTVRYLASGDEIFSLALAHRIGESTAYNIIHETCAAIHKALAPIYLREPVKQSWRNISNGFFNDWNMPNCLGAIDGKHISITSPPNSGSCFFNYKGFNSIVLLAVCNHRYEFTIVDVGAFGGESDGGILSRSEFGMRLNEGKLDLPPEKRKLPQSSVTLPYFFVGDEAFPLQNHLMRPFPGRNLDYKKRIFNYRLSRARRCIENAFGILVARWRVLRTSISCYPHHVDMIVLACVCLHNFLMAQTQNTVRNRYCPEEFIHENQNTSGDVHVRMDNEENSELSHENSNNRSSAKEAYNIRNKLSQYFISPEGEVSWQKDYVLSGSHKDF